MILPTIDYRRGAVEIIDQTLLPAEMRIRRLRTLADLEEAIAAMRVRGAPAIGLAAAYGMLLALEERLRKRVKRAPRYFFDRASFVTPFADAGLSARELGETLASARTRIAATRPTAANLFWALDRVMRAARHGGRDPFEICCSVAAEAFWIHHEELEIELAIGRNGERLIRDGMNVLTHCNAGGLATAGYGTALGVLYAAWEKGKRFHVYADETRPLLQGARLTAWELSHRGMPHTLLCDGAAASLLAAGRIDAGVVGADRIAANGDTANKVGTLALAVLCAKFKTPLYVAAPASTFDPAIPSGRGIPIEERAESEVTTIRGRPHAPAGTRAYNPAFDVTPAGLIRAIVTERGVMKRPNRSQIRLFTKR
jgi:methylthioribose-1-phosphate isomerase